MSLPAGSILQKFHAREASSGTFARRLSPRDERTDEFSDSARLSQDDNEGEVFRLKRKLLVCRNTVSLLVLRSHVLASITVCYRGISHPLTDRVEHRFELLLKFRSLQVDQSAHQNDQQHREEAKHHRRSPPGGSQ